MYVNRPILTLKEMTYVGRSSQSIRKARNATSSSPLDGTVTQNDDPGRVHTKTGIRKIISPVLLIVLK